MRCVMGPQIVEGVAALIEALTDNNLTLAEIGQTMDATRSASPMVLGESDAEKARGLQPRV